MRILVVEDEPAMAESLSWGLEQDGYVVDVAATGEEGLWLAGETAPDVIILDVMLPGLNGYQVCERLRRQQVWTPILMLTAMDDDLDQTEGLDIGADDYLTKPFSYPVLLARLRALTRRGMRERPAVLTAAGLTLDPGSRTAARGDAELDLTGREVAVLEYLLRNQGRVVSKTELLDHCWDAAYDGGPAVVEVLVHRLRRKIDPASGPATILTVRGEGYLVRDETP
ncbi:response regulator transcription factor [Streptomyces sp. NPDC006692]|uniref:response regulator transcription factor n=1 Tax=Streptomyces sp. NPDC006692 TaxID=3364758 RepID=UPI0036AFA6ED